ncbi:MAG: ABC transporter permease [Chloroflexota bacterium]|nr:ABC transporter permease [Chloroflexota bacterium]
MAVPTVPQTLPEEQATPATRIRTQIRRFFQATGRPLFALVLAMLVGGIVIMITSPGSPIDRFNEAITAYQALFDGAFGNLSNLSVTLVTATPLILTGLSVAIAFRAGLFNIGAAGQLAVGGMTAGIIGLTFASWSGWILIPLMLIASMLAGAVWGGIVGILKAWRGAHEVVTTIMLNFVAFGLTDYLINGPFQGKHVVNQTGQLPHQATLPHIADFYNSTLGTFLPQISQPNQYLVDVGFFFALLALVVYWFITARTTFGYELRVIGKNPGAARYAGIPIKRNIFFTMALAGAFSGLAGALQLMGQVPYQLIAYTYATQTTGFDAIGVALLGRMTSIGVLLGALLFGGLRQGGNEMGLVANVPGDLVFIIQAIVLFCIAAEFLPVVQTFWKRATPALQRSRSSKPALDSASDIAVEPLPKRDNSVAEPAQTGQTGVRPLTSEQEHEEERVQSISTDAASSKQEEVS